MLVATINQETVTRARLRVESAIFELNHIEDGFTDEHDRAARALVAALTDLQQLSDEFSPQITLPTANA
jgi:signal transduction histidine kinase